MTDPLHNPRCRANHMGLWAIEEAFLRTATAQIARGAWAPRPEPAAAAPGEAVAPERGRGFTLVDGLAVIPIMGAMMKGWSKFADVDTLAVRAAVRAAARDERVRAILLHIDSPGGSAAGTEELADDLRAADKLKPVYAHVDDLGGSAAYWVASQARRLTVNAGGFVGSIGTLLVVEDTSAQSAEDGVKVHVIATGPYKGAGTPGAPIEEHHVAHWRQRVEEINARFLAGVEAGRGRKGLKGDRLTAAADGRIWGGAKAKEMRLVDEVASFDEAVQMIRDDLEQDEARRRAERARARVARG